MKASYRTIHQPVVDMRESPSPSAKVVSQALFGEEIQLKEGSGEWTAIRTPDGYEGWIRGGFVERSQRYPRDLEVSRLCAHVYAVTDTEYGPFLTLPFGSPLQFIGEVDSRWIKIGLPDGKEAFIQKGDVAIEKGIDLRALSQRFLGLPYTWGGRSSFGFDCSGYIQMLYARQNVQLPRDARQQIACGIPIEWEELRMGDLLFWGKSATDIRHVGMSLDPPQFIHTSSRENKPYLRISSLLDSEWSGQIGVSYLFRTARRITLA